MLCKGYTNTHIISQLETQESDGDIELLSGILMPDHIHLTFRLGGRITLSQTIGKFKSKTSSLVSWQDNFFEHRIRADESEEDYAFYIFMNPYRSNLCDLSERWEWWYRWREIPYEFEDSLTASPAEGWRVPDEWIDKERETSLSLLVK